MKQEWKQGHLPAYPGSRSHSKINFTNFGTYCYSSICVPISTTLSEGILK